MTLPAHSSILTGLNPPNHGVRNNGEYRLAQEHTTLAEVLKGEGYDTGAFISAFVLDGRYGLDQGFDLYDGSVDPAVSLTMTDSINERTASSVTDAALDWLGTRDPARPFFAWVHYFDPHQPYRAPDEYRAQFPRRPYDSEIAYMDAEIGRLLGSLQASGVKERTLVIAVGDHGEGLGDHSESTHGVLIYDSVMHVPLIMSCPGVLSESFVIDDAVVSVVDIFPTVLALLGVAEPPPSDGVSLLAAGADRERSVYMECMTPYLDSGWAPLFSLRRHDSKYILAPRREHFDLQEDPGELNNLYVNPPPGQVGIRDSLVAELDEMLAQWPSVEEVADLALTLDPESIARLEALGYVSNAEPDPSLVTPDPKDMMPVMDKILEAKSLTRRGLHEEAFAAIQEAAEAAPHGRVVQHQIARLCLMMGRVDEAEVALRKCIAIRPRAQTFVLLAQILILDGRYDEANSLLLQAKTLEPKLGMIYIAHGDFAKAKGRLKEARDSYLHAAQVDPYRAEPFAKSRLAELRELIGRLKQGG
jgi:arylsulfatase A-like enzyme/predicted negative regulator of RcsB-dependent stress response